VNSNYTATEKIECTVTIILKNHLKRVNSTSLSFDLIFSSPHFFFTKSQKGLHKGREKYLILGIRKGYYKIILITYLMVS